mmetsp:Transcript_112979/g.224941  ORF Transcript_112979/g.224941 Transcript_112979/m.224941 type:complete len:136 (-) Transcript_112979:243-650(-)|eukprot:CAMPEP_0172766132 /NCGR_PEP_ID=MMETSP1074-20121228/180641_1 /TAXON_ID=2916 /ORGANISM="Ceratium fusus, Strain PA161109" /LENGTH=135 /DNA_ID=CAMNT_0013601189 /DNA_START=150 /DNA_END=557 /DNA_ORIENTATION=-
MSRSLSSLHTLLLLCKNTISNSSPTSEVASTFVRQDCCDRQALAELPKDDADSSSVMADNIEGKEPDNASDCGDLGNRGGHGDRGDRDDRGDLNELNDRGDPNGRAECRGVFSNGACDCTAFRRRRNRPGTKGVL